MSMEHDLSWQISHSRKGILLMVFCTIFTTIGQVMFKITSDSIQYSLFSLITNVPFILGLISYGVGALLLITALKYGELSVLYPIVSLTFIWVVIASAIMFAEPITTIKVFGIGSIILGVSLLPRGKKNG